MAILKGVLVGVAAFVVLILLVSTLGMVGPVEQVVCAALAIVAGIAVARHQRSTRGHTRSRQS